jgi:glutathione S-transferase
MLTIYGRPSSRGSRCLWALEEIGHPYRLEPIDYDKGENRTDAFLAISPAGKIPAMVDGSVVMTESMAITLYIARSYGAGAIWPSAEGDQQRCVQWAFWAATEVEPHAANLLDELLFKPADRPVRTEIVDHAQRKATVAMDFLSRQLQGQAYLLASGFSVADIAVASVVKWLKGAKHDLPQPVADWLARMMARPAQQRVLGLKKAAS